MVSLTPDMLGNSLVVMGITYVVMIAFSLYQLYLNWKQSKVNNQMAEVLIVLKEIRDELRKQ